MIPIHVIRAHKNFYENCCRLVFQGLSLIRWQHCNGLNAAGNKRNACLV